MSNAGKKLLTLWMDQATRQGWRIETTRGHLKWWRPDGTIGAVTASTPGSGARTMANIRGKLRRAGLKVN